VKKLKTGQNSIPLHFMQPGGHITLSELQALIKRELERALPLTYWVVAEVSELKVNYSGHCYMQLTEKSAKGEQARAQASAVAWRSSWGSIAAHFRAATGSDIAPGMKLLLRVAVSYHELYGLSLVVSDIDPAYTLGDLEAERQRTIARLQEEGVFGMNRELELPVPIQRIAVVSSRNAAGYQDFCKEIDRSPYRFEMTLFDAFMQGEAAEGSIVAALDAIADRMDEFDAVVVIRGGGSQNDLACFNAYRLCAHVAQFPLPVITGIGHDKDRSVADMVAAVELKTPTAVAGYLVEIMAGEDQYLASAGDRIAQLATGMLDTQRRNIVSLGVELGRLTGSLTRTVERRLLDLTAAVTVRKEALLMQRRTRLETMRLLIGERSARAVETQKARLQLMDARVRSHDPARITALGFAVVRMNGHVLKSSAQATAGEKLDITLADGRITAQVDKTE
jgi:exodeoxyribonuclease VII large subunit